MNTYCFYCMNRIEANGVCSNCGSVNDYRAPKNHLLPGTVLNKKYYIGEALGEGGFGITYIGRDTNLDVKVAIKEFYPNGYVNRSNTDSPCLNSSTTTERKDFFEKGKKKFLKEAQALARYSDEPGVVNVRDFFEENNTAYIVMEFLEGKTLKKYLKEKGKITPEETIEMLLPVINSLSVIHKQGLIHRDISPDNIMLSGNKIKLLDFGAARTVLATENRSLSIMLKPGYAPEEQYRSKGEQGPWTDIYALCATMYKCITGITPDDATQRVFSDDLKPPSALGIKISPEIENVIMKGMSVQQRDRYQSADELLEILLRFIEKEKYKKKNIKFISVIAASMVVILLVGIASYAKLNSILNIKPIRNLNNTEVGRLNTASEYLDEENYNIENSGCIYGLYTVNRVDFVSDLNGIHKYTSNGKITLTDQKTTSKFSIINNKLYYAVEDEISVLNNGIYQSEAKLWKYCSCWRMNLDGSEKEKLFPFIGGGYVIYVDENTVYYADDADPEIYMNLYEMNMFLYKYDLKTKESKLVDTGITTFTDNTSYPLITETYVNSFEHFTYSNGSIYYNYYDPLSNMRLAGVHPAYRYDIYENKVYSLDFNASQTIIIDSNTILFYSTDGYTQKNEYGEQIYYSDCFLKYDTKSHKTELIKDFQKDNELDYIGNLDTLYKVGNNYYYYNSSSLTDAICYIDIADLEFTKTSFDKTSEKIYLIEKTEERKSKSFVEFKNGKKRELLTSKDNTNTVYFIVGNHVAVFYGYGEYSIKGTNVYNPSERYDGCDVMAIDKLLGKK